MKATLTKLAAWATLVLAPLVPALAQQGPNPTARQAGYYDDADAGPVNPAAYADEGAAGNPGGGCTSCGSPDCAGRPGRGGCDRCRRPLGAWGSVEYLMLWQKGRDLPPLVTTNPNSGILPDGTILFGNDTVGNNMLSGGRVTAGLWLDSEDSLGVLFRFLGAESDRTGYHNGSDANGSPLLARPFINTQFAPTSSALLISAPGFARGNIDISTSSDLYTGEILGRINLDGDNRSRLDLIGGYHTTLIDDGLTIRSNHEILGGNLPVGTRFLINDDFNTRNQFHGGALGLWYDSYRGPWTISLLGKLSVGRMSEEIRIRGNTVVTDVGNNSTTYEGGLLAQRTNIGNYQRHETAFIPEINLTLSRQLTQRLDFTMGYSFVYWSTLVLAGDQVDPRVNVSQLVGGPILNPQDPGPPTFRDTDYWVHALSFGFNYRF